MNQKEVFCIIIRHDQQRQMLLESALRANELPVRVKLVNNLGQLKELLVHQPMILFCPETMQGQHHQKLIPLLQRLAPDCILASLAPDHWQGLASSRKSEIDI